jgi:sugar lactone lactonase YvrE
VSHVISAIRPAWAVPGALVSVEGLHLPVPPNGPPHVLVGSKDAHVVSASHSGLAIVIPEDAEPGEAALRIDELPGETIYVRVARSYVTGVHQVDSPAFGADGLLYCTMSGGRGTKSEVPIYRIDAAGARQPLSVDIANPTSMALGPDGYLYVSSRFDGQVHRVFGDDRAELYVTDLGVATGVAFSPHGDLYVGDRSGTILRVDGDRKVEPFATLPASVAAFHLAFGPDSCLYVSAPTLSTRDAIYRITPDRLVDEVCRTFGRPQGLAFDSTGALYVVDALAGRAGLYRVNVNGSSAERELVVAAPSLVGVAFAPSGGLVLASAETIWWLDCSLTPYLAG